MLDNPMIVCYDYSIKSMKVLDMTEMLAVVGCFGCGGHELPEHTFSMMYKVEETSKLKRHWLCKACVRRFDAMGELKIHSNMTDADMHPDAQQDYDGFSPCVTLMA